jgi:hypothetical protein
VEKTNKQKINKFYGGTENISDCQQIMTGIPTAISNILLPSPKLSIIDFNQFLTPPNTLGRQLSTIPNLFSEAKSPITDERLGVRAWIVDVLTEKPTSKVQNVPQIHSSNESNNDFSLKF